MRDTPDLQVYQSIESPEDDVREKAHLNFLLAALEIEKYGYEGKPVEGNPLQVLRNRVWPEWHRAMHSQRPVSAKRNYLKFLAHKDEKTGAISGMIDEWATECWLVEADQNGVLRPARWAVEYAQQLCEGWSRTKLGQDNPLWWQKGLREKRAAGNDCEVSPDVAIWIEAPRPGESPKDYRRRVRPAINAQLHIIEHTSDFGGIGAKGKGRKKRLRKRDGLEHYRYLVLYQCCKWSLKMIIESAKPEELSGQRISQGYRSAAKLVGLQVRPKSVKKEPPKSAQNGS